MQVDIATLMSGKGTLIKGKEYYSTEAYVTPFLEKMSKYTNKFEIQVTLPNQISITKKEDLNLEDTIFNRVWIQAVLPDSMNYPNHYEAIHLLYALDTKNPLVKIARSTINGACLNQCIFNPSFLKIQQLEPETAIDYSFVEPLMEASSDMGDKLHRLAEMEIPYDQRDISERLGNWVRNTISSTITTDVGKVKLSTSTPISAYKMLYVDHDSKYYVNYGNSTSGFNIYNAWTQCITDDKRDIINKLEKTLLLMKILELK